MRAEDHSGVQSDASRAWAKDLVSSVKCCAWQMVTAQERSAIVTMLVSQHHRLWLRNQQETQSQKRRFIQGAFRNWVFSEFRSTTPLEALVSFIGIVRVPVAMTTLGFRKIRP